MHTHDHMDLEIPETPTSGPFWQFYNNLTGYSGLTDLYEAVARLIPQTLRTEASAVALIDKNSNEITIPAAWAKDGEILHRLHTIRLSGKQKIPMDLFQSNAPAMENNFKDSQNGFQYMDPFVFDYVSSRLVVPLSVNRQKFGILWTINKMDGAFDSKDVETLSAIAAITVFGIEAIYMRNAQCQSGQSMAQFNQAKNRAIHYLSHALKTPIAVLIASISLLEKHLAQLADTSWKEITDRAHRNLKRLLSVEYEIEDILRQKDGASLGNEAEIIVTPTPSSYASKEQTANPAENFFGEVNIEFLVHELKSPVSIIETATRLLLNKQSPEAPLTLQQQNTLVRVLRNALKTRQMLNQLLEIGRAQAACFNCRPLNVVSSLKEILFEATESSAPELHQKIEGVNEADAKLSVLAQNGIRLESSSEMEGMLIEQDETKFRQIVGNLIKNGLYYRKRYLIIHATCRKEILSISVRDDGPGIAEMHHEAIFERYKQIAPCEGVARNGHGLGLAMARAMARRMGGDIRVESELGQGALFRFSLPPVFPGLQRLTEDSDV